MAIITNCKVETNLGFTLASQISASANSFVVNFFDRVTGAARDPDSSNRTNLLVVVDKGSENSPNPNYEIMLFTSMSGGSPTGTWTVTAVRGLAKTGLSWSAGTGSIHQAGAEGGCVDVAQMFNSFSLVMGGTTGTGANNWRIGDETDSDITVYAQNADASKPFFQYDSATSAWVYSNDGVSSTPFGTGAGVTGGNGIDITAGVISVDRSTSAVTGTNISGLEFSSGTIGVVKDLNWTTDYTYGDTIAAGEVVYLDTADAKWKLADGNGSNTYLYDRLGIALDAGVDTDTGKRVALPGSIITGLTGLTAGTQYLSDTAGGISATAGTNQTVLGFAPNATTMLFFPQVMTDAQARTMIGNDEVTTHAHGLTSARILMDTQTTEFYPAGDFSRTAASGTTTDAGRTHEIVTQAADNAIAYIGLNAGTGYPFASSVHDKNPEFNIRVQFNAATAQEGFIGYTTSSFVGSSLENAAMTLDHFGFVIEDGTIYASVADGTTQQKSSALGTTLTNWNSYRATFNGTTATFYVNGSSVATLSTNVPDNNLTIFCAAVIADASAAAKTLRVAKQGGAQFDRVN